MDKQEIMEFLNIGENCEIEFKTSKKQLPKSLWETYSAFCNSKGGIIILGAVEKKGKVELEGIENVVNIQKDFWNTINNKSKVNLNVLENEDVKVYDIDGKTIMIIKIHNVDRTSKPVYINNNPMIGTYKRNYEGDYVCTEKEVRKLITESAINTKDTLIIDDMTIENINKETLESYRSRFKVHKGKDHEWNKLEDSEFLKVIGAIDRATNKLTIAGLLIFSNEEDIVKNVPDYFLDYREILEKDTENRWSHRITSWDDNWSGNLFDFYNKISQRLIADIEVPFALNQDMTRIEDTEIHECVREALVNTLSHANFFESGSIVVEKGIDYFKFANPGDMRVPFERAKQGGESDPRNKLIHKIFSLVGLGERAGSGIYKITNAWKKKEWIEPVIEELYNPDRTVLTLKMKKNKNNIENYTKSERIILEEIKKKPNITQTELSETIGISKRSVTSTMNKLKERGIIERVGTYRNGFWRINL